MSERFWLRLGAASGIGAALVGIIGFSLLASSSAFIPPDATQERVAAAIAAQAPLQAFVGQFFQALATLLLVIFAARLWLTLRQAEGDPGWLSASAFGAALVLTAMGMGAQVPEYAIALGAGHGLGSEGAWALHFLNFAFFIMTWGLSALFLGATAVVVLRMHALPHWLGWSAAAIALANLAALATPTADLAQLAPMFVQLWILVTSIVLLRRTEERRTEEPRPAVSRAPV